MSSARSSSARSRDTGMAMVVVLLLAFLTFERKELLVAALITQLVTMAVPGVFRPVSIVWFAAAHALGAVMSVVLLSVVFFLIVTPVGWIRRVFGRDPLRLRDFKAGEASVLVERRHTFVADDLEHPY